MEDEVNICKRHLTILMMKYVATSRWGREHSGDGIIDVREECHTRSHEVCIEVCVICAGLVHIDHDFLHATDSCWSAGI